MFQKTGNWLMQCKYLSILQKTKKQTKNTTSTKTTNNNNEAPPPSPPPPKKTKQQKTDINQCHSFQYIKGYIVIILVERLSWIEIEFLK